MAKTVVGLLDDREEAQSVVLELVDEGFDRNDISIMASNPSGSSGGEGYDALSHSTVGASRNSGEIAGDVAADTMKGAGTGAVLGGIAGLVAGVVGLAIPGIGSVVAAGPLAAALAGAGIGAVAGGIIAALTNIGVPEEEAHYYAEGMRRGGVLVAVNTAEDDMAEQAAAIMRDHGAVDIDKRAQTWKESGWSRFDETASPYSSTHNLGYSSTGRGSRAYTGIERRQNTGAYSGVDRRAAA